MEADARLKAGRDVGPALRKLPGEILLEGEGSTQGAQLVLEGGEHYLPHGLDDGPALAAHRLLDTLEIVAQKGERAAFAKDRIKVPGALQAAYVREVDHQKRH